MPPQREWTVLLYMAGDNGRLFHSHRGDFSLMAQMTGPGVVDLNEAESVGSTDDMAVLAQFDTLPAHDTLAPQLAAAAGSTYRLEVRQGRSVSGNVVEVLEDVNTGNPVGLAQFIVWGMTRCPAKRTLLVLWNHGLGWRDSDIYQQVRSQSRGSRAGEPERSRNLGMFRSTAATVARRARRSQDDEARGILCDDTSLDFLTNVELSQALRVAEFAADEAEVQAIFADKSRLAGMMRWGNEGARRRLNLLGMDACLMAMIEVQYQVRRFAEVLVASQEVEPMNGWPYHTILAELAARPTMTSRELATLIVDHYADSYSGRSTPNITQSAVDLSRMAEAERLLRPLARALAREIGQDLLLEKAFDDARDKATRNGYAFEDPEYLDLTSLLAALQRGYRGDAAASKTLAAAQALHDWLLSAASPVLHNRAEGKFSGKAHGISIYVPRTMPSPLYKQLDFAASGWLNALTRIYQA